MTVRKRKRKKIRKQEKVKEIYADKRKKKKGLLNMAPQGNLEKIYV